MIEVNSSISMCDTYDIYLRLQLLNPLHIDVPAPLTWCMRIYVVIERPHFVPPHTVKWLMMFLQESPINYMWDYLIKLAYICVIKILNQVSVAFVISS